MRKSAGWRFLPLMLGLALLPAVARAETPVPLKYDQATIEAKWRARIQSFLDRGVIPLIDVESSLRQDDADRYLAGALPVMDRLGIALISFDSYQAPKDGKTKGFRWGYTGQRIVNAHPDRFILATNGGTNRNWFRQKMGKTSFLKQTIRQIETGDYPQFGEIEFRHYQSSGECKEGRTDRDINIPIDGPSGQMLFQAAAKTGRPLLIHFEPEDAVIPPLERMLSKYPKAQLIIAHFGQIRNRFREARFGPALVRELLTKHPNLHYDISVGGPNRTYACTGQRDTVLWQADSTGTQSDTLDPAYKAIFLDFPDRFVTGFDYGGGRPPLNRFLKERAANARLIMRDLPPAVQNDIAWRNAWRLLTRKKW